jgi:hypothetical protein
MSSRSARQVQEIGFPLAGNAGGHYSDPNSQAIEAEEERGG